MWSNSCLELSLLTRVRPNTGHSRKNSSAFETRAEIEDGDVCYIHKIPLRYCIQSGRNLTKGTLNFSHHSWC